jgi:hypothetical protein
MIFLPVKKAPQPSPPPLPGILCTSHLETKTLSYVNMKLASS